MSFLKTSSSVFVSSGVCEFSRTFDGTQLRIHIEVSEKEHRQICGTVTLEQDHDAFHYEFSKIDLPVGATKQIGSFIPVFERQYVTINCGSNIPVDRLGPLSNETLLTISAAANGVLFRSNYLNVTI